MAILHRRASIPHHSILQDPGEFFKESPIQNPQKLSSENSGYHLTSKTAEGKKGYYYGNKAEFIKAYKITSLEIIGHGKWGVVTLASANINNVFAVYLQINPPAAYLLLW